MIDEAPMRKIHIEQENRNKILQYVGKWDDFRVRREEARHLYCALRYRGHILRKLVVIKLTINIVR